MNFKNIILYNEPAVSEINITQLRNFLEEKFPVKVKIEENVFSQFNDEQVRNLSAIRIKDIKNSFTRYDYNENEFEFERKMSNDSSLMESTIKVEDAEEISQVFMYDGFELQRILRYLNKDEQALHIIITNRLICTFDDNDDRYLSLIHI